MARTDSTRAQAPLTGVWLWLAAFVVAGSNFIAVLDMTIANVSVSTIAGNLGATISQGTWVITSYAVAEAITVPLTGWLAARFGPVRVFVTSMALFGLSSLACGLAPTFGLLVTARIFQGLFGGPLMPVSQALLMQIFPREKAAAANGIWAMTTLIAPILGPILGGHICDEYHWGWIFLINVPVALAGALLARRLLGRYEKPTVRNPIDRVGLALLLAWVAALQLMLDEGKDLDWFSSPYITGLAIVAVVGFAAFLIWEYYEEHPIVDIRVFRHRGFTVAVTTLSLGFAALFASNVLTPLWLQNFMGYSAHLSGKTTAWSGVLAVLSAPIIAGLATRTDPRRLVFTGLCWLGMVALWRAYASTDMDYAAIALPLFVMGIGMPLFFVPVTGIALGSVAPTEVASAAGLMSFVRTLSGAVGTSLVTTTWEDLATADHTNRVGSLDADGMVATTLQGAGLGAEAALRQLDGMLQAQSIMISTNQLMLAVGCAYLLSACLIWLARKPERAVDPAAAGH